MKWIKCTDRLPKLSNNRITSKYVLLCFYGFFVVTGFYNHKRGVWEYPPVLDWDEPTHWANLPKPPNK